MIEFPQRIVCLSAETADWFWRIGAWDRVVGVTAFFEQPKEAPPKPRVSGFSTAHFDNIDRLKPDLVVTFSDVQASLSAEVIRRGIPVLATNQRTLAEVEGTLMLLARMVERERQGEVFLDEFRRRTAPVCPASRRPRVYFEEWNDPLISGISWVSELIERAGGTDVFQQLRTRRAAPDRVVSSVEVRQADPEVILASWCGKPVEIPNIGARIGWANISAVRKNRIYEIPSEEILQPGFRLLEGFEHIKGLVTACLTPSR